MRFGSYFFGIEEGVETACDDDVYFFRT